MNRIDLLREWKSDADGYTLRLVGNLPEELSDFAPVANMMSFSRLVFHLAECELEMTRDIIRTLPMAKTGPELAYDSNVINNVRALKEVFDFTDTVLRGISDADLEGIVKFPGRSSTVSVLQIVKTMIEHQLHHRGQLITYCRMNEIDFPLRWKD